MPTSQQRERWRSEKKLIEQAAWKVRTEAHRGQVEQLLDRGPIIPVRRFKFVALLDELALAAGRGELPRDIGRVTVELCRSILDSDAPITQPDVQWPD